MGIRIVAAQLAFGIGAIGLAFGGVADAQTPPAAHVPSGEHAAPAASTELTPPRLSYLFGQVSFWRPGAEAWAPARLNIPLAPGDALYTGPNGTVEIQAGSRAFVRAAPGTQLGVDNQELDYLQLRVTAGYAGLDLRGLPAGQVVELDTPNAAFTIERPGYYRVDVDADSTAFATYRGGTATMTLPDGTASRIASAQQIVIAGTDSPRLLLGATPALTAWDRWGYQRSDYLLQPVGRAYIAPAVYGAEALERYGSWRVVETYGPVWIPAGVPVGWAPYSTGRWIWDPRFGWTWLDDAPWGWAPYHYGRWVHIGSFWAWTPGPIVVRPVYAPALVVFLGGPAVGVVRPLCWAPLAWGEPVIPWWGRPGFIGVPWWGGWGGPRVVNNVVIAPTTVVTVTNITVYRNVSVTNAVVGVPANKFGHGYVRPTPVSHTEAQQLSPVSGPTTVAPVPASVVPATGPAPAPPATIQSKSVVATRPSQQGMPPPRQGLPAARAPAPPPASVIVPAPASVAAPPPATGVRPGSSSSPKPATPSSSAPSAPPTQAPAPSTPPRSATPPPSTPSTPPTQAPGPSTPPKPAAPPSSPPSALPMPAPSTPAAPPPRSAPPSTGGVPSTGSPAVVPPPVAPATGPKVSAPAPPPPPSKRRERSDVTGTAPTPGQHAAPPPPPPPAERPPRVPSPPHQPSPPRADQK